MARVLVIEDTEEISDLLQAVLEAAGMEVVLAATGPDGLAAARESRPDVVILDLNLPGLDGVEVCRELRTTSDAYVLMLTARTDEIDRVVGLTVGADDYVTKPFSPREVQARVQALLRRPRGLVALGAPAAVPPGADSAAGIRRVSERVALDAEARRVIVAGAPVTLTRIEFDLLDAVSENPRRVLSRSQLRDRVWGGDWLADDHAVDVHMSNLRRKLRAAGGGDVVATVRGVGYRMGDEPGARG
ncbi:MAG: DNA-binding response regulator [Pseudonocardiales bacterium]|nr:DNA-binding response regulator [Pseudonocardiales bacterium]